MPHCVQLGLLSDKVGLLACSQKFPSTVGVSWHSSGFRIPHNSLNPVTWIWCHEVWWKAGWTSRNPEGGGLDTGIQLGLEGKQSMPKEAISYQTSTERIQVWERQAKQVKAGKSDVSTGARVVWSEGVMPHCPSHHLVILILLWNQPPHYPSDNCVFAARWWEWEQSRPKVTRGVLFTFKAMH